MKDPSYHRKKEEKKVDFKQVDEQTRCDQNWRHDEEF